MNRLMLPGHMKTIKKDRNLKELKTDFEHVVLARSKKQRAKKKKMFDLLHAKDKPVSSADLKVESLKTFLPSAQEMGLEDFEEKNGLLLTEKK